MDRTVGTLLRPFKLKPDVSSTSGRGVFIVIMEGEALQSSDSSAVFAGGSICFAKKIKMYYYH